jgi:hypothetical protein
MRGFFLSFSERSATLLVGLLVLSTHFLWAQRTSPLATFPIQLFATPAPFARASETQTSLHLTYGLRLTFEQNHGQTDPSIRFLLHYPGYDGLPLNIDAVLDPARRASEFWSIEKYLIGSAPSKWPAFAPIYSTFPDKTNYRFENLEQFGQSIPLAGSIMLRIGQQAKAHPRVTRVLTMLQPRL